MVASGVGPGEHGESTAIWIINLLAAVPHQIRGNAQGAVPSPDGSLIAFRSSNGPEVGLISADGGDFRSIASAMLNETFGQLQWSPDGKRIGMIVRRIGDPQGTIESIDVSTGRRSEMARVPRPVSFVWLADGRMIVASSDADQGAGTILHEFDTRGRETPIPIGPGSTVAQMSATADGQRLVLVRQNAQSDAYVATIGKNDALEDVRRVTLDDRDDLPSGWLPDSRTILFSSNRNGSLGLFREKIDSPTAEQVAFGPEKQYAAEPTSDGKALVYWSSMEGNAQAHLMRLPVAGGTAETILDAPAASSFHCASAVPECLLATVNNSALELSTFDPHKPGTTLLRKIPLKLGSGKLQWAIDATETSIAFADESGLNLLDLRTGEVSNIPADQLPGSVTGIAAAGKSGWIVTVGSSANNEILLASRSAVRKLWSSQRPVFSPALSPDGKHLLFGGTSTSSNAWLIEHF